MKIYLLTQDVVCGYDTYDSVVVIAENEDEARKIHPSGFVTHIKDGKWMGTYSDLTIKAGQEYENDNESWVLYKDIDKIIVKEIGVANSGQEKGIVLASFNAG